MKQSTALIIPAHNEAKRIADVLSMLSKHTASIIVVDDGSSDATAAIVRRHGVCVLTHAVNLGKGAALRTGVEYARDAGFDSVVLMDADGQHDPHDLPHFLKALKSSELVLGYRDILTSNSFVRYIGNKLDEWLISILYGVIVKDPICGYRAFRLSIYPAIKWSSCGYEVETEMIILAIKKRINFIQIRVATKYLDYYKGVSILNAWKIMFDVVKWRLLP